MKRDMDLIRNLLLTLESSDRDPNKPMPLSSKDADLELEGYTSEQVDYHVMLLYEAGFIRHHGVHEGEVVFSRLSWEGHEFLDAIRDPEVWKKTKEGASKVGGFGVGLIKDLATGYIKHMAKEKLGFEI
ncbi:DUF2513 domain-containing protein [Microvirga sesbaniae]|uniref:DUF2513 domain-containing protein n=1 Tax=Microvirga sesbaniae TaxID=681392 RepID=UPI0021C69811|nr:DUF2513 domain-containing protein [Microvirga sp. HBU67692]